MDQSTGAFRILLISCITLYFLGKVNCGSVVDVGETQIVGQTVYAGERTVSQFLAIPYAEAPTGQLRFKKPVPRRYLPDLYYAFNQPPACWQRSAYPFPSYDASPFKDEDCLFLNIWVPEHSSSDNKKAVIYFVHGGGFRFGSIRQNSYNAAAMAAHGDVIVVTVNYRLGSFGFLTSGTEEAPGNIGLYDILEGLKWVNKNIEAFGGDSSRITLAGEGAGSIAAGILTISPLAKGLFQRIIMESGAPGYPDRDSVKTNLDISQKVAERLYCANRTHTIQNNPDDVLKCLRRVSPQALTDVTASIHPLSSVLYIPQFGGDLLPQDPQKALQRENFTCTDLLIGNTRDEGSYMLTTSYPVVYGFFGALEPNINKTAGKKQIRSILSEFKDSNAIAQHYLPQSLSEKDHDAIRTQVYTALGDATVVCPEMFYAEQCAKMGGAVYYYIWNHRPTNSVWFPWMGVAHGTEVEFVFGLPLLHPYAFVPEEATLSKNIMNIWASFAKDGKPSIPWPEYSKQNPQVKVLGAGANQQRDQKGFHQENCNFFRQHFGFK